MIFTTKEVLDIMFPERWMRRFDKEKKVYPDNWEKV